MKPPLDRYHMVMSPNTSSGELFFLQFWVNHLRCGGTDQRIMVLEAMFAVALELLVAGDTSQWLVGSTVERSVFALLLSPAAPDGNK